MQLNSKVLKTIKNYADSIGISPSYIYKLEKEGKMRIVMVDGVKFVDVSVYPTIPVTNRRK